MHGCTRRALRTKPHEQRLGPLGSGAMSAEAWSVDTALVLGLVGLVLGALVPDLIARIPEPDPEPDPVEEDVVEPVDGAATGRADTVDAGRGSEADAVVGGVAEPEPAPEPETREEKERYDAIAALPGLRWKTALAGAVVAAVLGGRVGWSADLLFLTYLVPVGVALALVDWRTQLLPTRVIAPSYAVVGVLVVAAAAIAGDWGSLLGSVWGWLTWGGTYFVLWFVYPRGMGYGDVRLAGLLGIALGHLGWSETLTGLYAGFILGALGGLGLALLRLVDRKASPFGPWMLVGALVGVVLAPGVAAWYA